jgi:hypothetical protein
MAMIALDIALLVAAAFDAVGCEYFLGGSVASSPASSRPAAGTRT